MMLKQGKDAAQIGDHDVGSLREADARGPFLDELDAAAAAVVSRDLPCDCDSGFVGFQRVDNSRAEVTRQNSKNARAGADVQHHGTWSYRLAKRTRVRIHAHAVAHHPAVFGNRIHSSTRSS